MRQKSYAAAVIARRRDSDVALKKLCAEAISCHLQASSAMLLKEYSSKKQEIASAQRMFSNYKEVAAPRNDGACMNV